ncbi:hypothetical protein PIROE2DRAFT_61751 [Piromyces sp. E2]|nr:hypothetical protein PIROE2DRAFT_61751 [Piromyces sp. E2]|eukprot:OUM62636.1 hypothetical protein PIROE2DRAFT_61751 [Piromyces sp. E2]
MSITIPKSNEEESNSQEVIIDKVVFKSIFEGEKYDITVLLLKISKLPYIKFIAKNENVINFIYTEKYGWEDIKKLSKTEKLLRQYDSIEELFSSISDMFIIDETKNGLSIKEINHSNLVLIRYSSDTVGLRERPKYQLILKRKDCDESDTIEILCTETIKLKNKSLESNKKFQILIDTANDLKRENTELKDENKLLKKQLNKYENAMEIIKFQLNNKIFETPDEVKFIEKRLLQIPGNEGKKVRLEKKYSSSSNGPTPADFHSMCDGITNNLILIKTIKNQRFGGFTQLGWSKPQSACFKKDNNCFCFSLTNKTIYNIVKDKDAVYHHTNYGPWFGNNGNNGYVFYVGNGNSGNTLNYGTCGSSNDFKGENTYKSYEINGGDNTFRVLEFEVYQVIFE